MPTYEYRCKKCKHHFEEFQSITAKPLKKCPKCKTGNVVRVVSGGAGFIFKGSGFYETDYRSSDYKKKASEDKKAESGSTSSSSSDKKSDSKSSTNGTGKKSD